MGLKTNKVQKASTRLSLQLSTYTIGLRQRRQSKRPNVWTLLGLIIPSDEELTLLRALIDFSFYLEIMEVV